jgi:hypothetical protein
MGVSISRTAGRAGLYFYRAKIVKTYGNAFSASAVRDLEGDCHSPDPGCWQRPPALRPTSGRDDLNRTISGQRASSKLTTVRPSRYRPGRLQPEQSHMLSTLRAFGEWLATTSLSNIIQNVSWIIPTIQTIHIVCVAIVISGTFLVDLRILGLFARSQTLASLSDRFLTWIWWTLIVLLVTGSLLVTGEPGRSITNPAFFAKMIMLVIVATLTYVLQRPLVTDAGYWDGNRAVAAKGIAIVSLLLWSCIVFAGRWIAYVTAL